MIIAQSALLGRQAAAATPCNRPLPLPRSADLLTSADTGGCCPVPPARLLPPASTGHDRPGCEGLRTANMLIESGFEIDTAPFEGSLRFSVVSLCLRCACTTEILFIVIASLPDSIAAALLRQTRR